MSYRDATDADALLLVDRLTRALLTRGVARADARDTPLSDSLHAVKEYFAGVRSARANQWVAAGRHYSRALTIDSSFAFAALKQWESVLHGSAFPRAPGPRDDSADFNLAWSLRDRLSMSHRLYLQALGQSFLHSDVVSQTAASEAAARAAPDDARVWTWWAGFLADGASWTVPNWRQRAIAVVDSAIALDSTDVTPVRLRLRLALHVRSVSEIREYLALLERLGSESDAVEGARWAAAQVLNDSIALQEIRTRLTNLSPQSVGTMANLALAEGLPLADVQQALELRRTNAVKSTEFSVRDAWLLFHVFAARGRVREALALADSAMHLLNRAVFFGEQIVRQAVLEPGLGYESAAAEIAPRLADSVGGVLESSYQVNERSVYCTVNAFLLLRGDTGRARAAIHRLRSIADSSPVFALRKTRGGTCPDLLQGLMDVTRSPNQQSTSLRRLDSLVTRGLFWDRIYPTATVLLARLQESQGRYDAALATSAKRTRRSLDYMVAIWPAALRMEGRLAAARGDTAGAIRAYTHYLTLRDKPDPGPMANEVADVRAHLAQLRRAASR
jgi:hypothetical protein